MWIEALCVSAVVAMVILCMPGRVAVAGMPTPSGAVGASLDIRASSRRPVTTPRYGYSRQGRRGRRCCRQTVSRTVEVLEDHHPDAMRNGEVLSASRAQTFFPRPDAVAAGPPRGG